MSCLPSFDTLDAAQVWLLRNLMECGSEVRPRASLTRELLGVGFVVTHPRTRCLTNRKRRFNLPLAIGEFAWHAAGSDELSFVAYYAPRWRDFADDDTRVTGSCYGAKIFGSQFGTSQWQQLTDTLRDDVHSRRAILSLWDIARPTTSDVKDVPCTCTIQFLIRDHAVHAVVHMRSNDVIWGLPYDFFFFTMLQELLAEQLNLPLGTYTHFASSMHIYDRHFALAEQILADPDAEAFEMPRLSAAHQLPEFLAVERATRLNGSLPDVSHFNEYWRELIEVLFWFRSVRDAGKMAAVRAQIPPSRYARLLKQMIRPTAPETLASG
ncbi:MAG TPA: thymidylate synthase [Thermoanaerobaculia bacterium]|nr:thymidylate synthase [Thermoanaerobaculia bacterium]